MSMSMASMSLPEISLMESWSRELAYSGMDAWQGFQKGSDSHIMPHCGQE